jgi:hypothetical protein
MVLQQAARELRRLVHRRWVQVEVARHHQREVHGILQLTELAS